MEGGVSGGNLMKRELKDDKHVWNHFHGKWWNLMKRELKVFFTTPEAVGAIDSESHEERIERRSPTGP